MSSFRLYLLSILFFAWVNFLAAGCGGSGECRFDGDCPQNKICEEGQCTSPSGGGGKDGGGTVDQVPQPSDQKVGECEDGYTRQCYTGPEQTKGIGECKAGVQECVNGKWGECKNQVLPQQEQCDGKDNDCDGKTDEGCACKPGDVQDCYGGPDGTAGVGICKKGSQKCQSDGQWGKCEGEIRPKAEVCNGLDDDCNGKIDDNIPSPPLCDKQNGVCARSVKKCGGTKGWLPCTEEHYKAHSKAYEVDEKTCDNLDNDCDGAVDENLSRPCFTGASGCKKQPDGSFKCQGGCKSGVETCVNGSWSSCTGQVLPQPESCNGKDDNCDGKIDENCQCQPGKSQSCYNGPAGTAGVGVCQKGRQICQANGKWGPCSGEVVPSKEICNGKDDDCNGKIDDNLVGPPCDKNFGVCAGLRKKCGGAQGWLPCSESDYKKHSSNYQKEETLCDNLDNDCDGSIDENLSRSCYSASSGCSKSGSQYNCTAPCKAGKQYCQNGKWGSCIGQVVPKKETCNGKDDDCNGKIDDNIPDIGQKCTVPNQKGICSEGKRACDRGQLICKQVNQPKKEICPNGKDDDCNGKVDDCAVCQAGQTRPCYNGSSGCKKSGNSYSCMGACKAGVQSCVNGQWGPCKGQVIPSLEKCNWTDDDCDGKVDENGVCLYFQWSSLSLPSDANAVSFIDNRLGIAVGNGGKVWRTNDGGGSWVSITSGTTKNLSAVATLPKGLVIAVGDGGTVIRSTDSGLSFKAIKVPTTASLYAVVIRARKVIAAGRSGVIIISSDAGLSWQKVSSPSRRSIYSLSFASSYTVIGVGSSGYIVRSTDGGKSWKLVSSGTSNHLNAVAFSGSLGLAVGNKGTILRSSNYGSSWKAVKSGVSFNLSSVLAPGKNVFVVAGFSDKFLLSVDGGNTFEQRPFGDTNTYSKMTLISPAEILAFGGGRATLGQSRLSLQTYRTYGTFYGVAFHNGTSGDPQALAVGSFSGYLYRSDDRGRTWHPVFLPVDTTLRAVSLFGNNALAVGYGGTILRSTDRGKTWTKVSSPTTSSLYGVSLFNNNAVAVGASKTLLYSSDAGKTWKSLTAPSPPSSYSALYSVSLKDKDALAVGSSGWMISSSDGGKTWKRINSGLTSSTLYDVIMYYLTSVSSKIAVGASGTIVYTHPSLNGQWKVIKRASSSLYGVGVDYSSAVAVGSSGTLLYSSNRMNLWSPILGLPNISIRDAFRNYLNDIYLAVGGNSLILRSLNLGKSWYSPLIPSVTLYAAVFANQNIAFAFGDYGVILRSPDAGLSWYLSATPTTSSLRGAAKDSAGVIVAVGTSGTVIRSADGGKTFSKLSSSSAGTLSSLYSVASPGSGIFVAVGSGSTIIRSINGGLSFSKVSSPVSYRTLYAIDCKGNLCVIAGSSGTILRSTTSGASFSKVSSPTSFTLYSVAVGSNKNVVIGGSLGVLLYSTDGGASWKKANSPTSSSIYAVYALSAERFVAFDYSGRAYGSGDGGKSWFLLSPDLPSSIRSFAFNGSKGVAVGSSSITLTFK